MDVWVRSIAFLSSPGKLAFEVELCYIFIHHASSLLGLNWIITSETLEAAGFGSGDLTFLSSVAITAS